jgi:hydrogenase expression/formation protein HypC
MCLSIPARVLSINQNLAKVDVGGTVYTIGLNLVDNVKVGDYVLTHSGFAISVLSPDEGREQAALVKQAMIIND